MGKRNRSYKIFIKNAQTWITRRNTRKRRQLRSNKKAQKMGEIFRVSINASK
jgi:hypothetical protein